MNAEREQLVKELDLDSRVQYEVLETLASLGPATFVISAINAGLAFYILRESAGSLLMLVWLLFMMAVIFSRLLAVLIFWRTRQEKLRLRGWFAVYLPLVYITGIGWGLLPLTPAFDNDPLSWGFIIFMISGMATGGLTTLYVKKSLVIPYLVLILMPLTFALASGERPADFAMCILSGLYLVTLVRSSYYLNNMANRTIRLDAENQHLFEFLLKAKRLKDD